MKRTALTLLIFSFTFALAIAPAGGDALKVLTINVWSGLDYKGIFRSGDYETPDRREARFRSLVTQAKELSPDVIFVQEANPVDRYAARLAEALRMEEVHQVVNGGKRIGSWGIPVNLKEGLVILARPDLSLTKVDAWKLSGTWGIHTDLFTFHHTEAVIILAARIKSDQEDIFLVNVHLAASPLMPEDLDGFRKKVLAETTMSDDQFRKALKKWRKREQRRFREMEKLLGRLQELPSGAPLIVAGDFNDGPGSRVIQTFMERGGFTEVLAETPEEESCTWDPARNANTAFSSRVTDARGKAREGYELLASLVSEKCRRLDYIFMLNLLPARDPGDGRIVMTDISDGIMTSDHFGVYGEVSLSRQE